MRGRQRDEDIEVQVGAGRRILQHARDAVIRRPALEKVSGRPIGLSVAEVARGRWVGGDDHLVGRASSGAVAGDERQVEDVEEAGID